VTTAVDWSRVLSTGGRILFAGISPLAGPSRRSLRRTASPLAQIQLEELTDLVYELLDAHDDTAMMAAGLAGDPSWIEHLAYLRALQRAGREALARIWSSDEHE
jgi:hypothetical protein